MSGVTGEISGDSAGLRGPAGDARLPATASAARRPQKASRHSSLYGPFFWRVGVATARVLPPLLGETAARLLARTYARLHSRRREVVVKNLLPATCADRERAEQTAIRLFENFAVKLLDLWKFEAGLPIRHLFSGLQGRAHYDAALKTGRGVLLLTPHLGNWEFGAPLLTMNGYSVQVVTLAEPGRGFTEMRQAARARWGVETVVVGSDPFAFIEIIRRLEAGATIALLIDRPPGGSATPVRLFGHSFHASVAPAELARATGCELLPAYVVREGNGYRTEVLPRIPYERSHLRDRAARQKLTQAVTDVFAAPIMEHLDQWYHFLPLWDDSVAGERNEG